MSPSLVTLGLVTSLLVAMTTPAMGATTIIQLTTNLVDMTDARLPSTMVTRPRTNGTGVVEAVSDLIEESCIFDEDNLFFRRLAKLETNDGNNLDTYGTAGYYGGIWKVDQATFRDTLVDSPTLRAKYAAIRDAFGIDWLSLNWQDLQKPLYSGLAAALYLFEEGSIPMSVELQATFVQTAYHSSDTAYDFMRESNNIPVCDHNQNIDIVFLLDSASTANDFQRMSHFAATVIDSPFDLSAGNIRVGLYQFGDSTHLERDIALDSNPDPQQLLSDIRSLQKEQVSHISVDIGTAVKTVVADAFGSNVRPLSAKMVIVITDKTSNNAQMVAEAGQDAQDKGVTVMVVAVGSNVNDRELAQLVTPPVCRHRLDVPDFRDLPDITTLMQRTICNEPMLAKDPVSCAMADCRNLAFPVIARPTTITVRTTCGDGTLYVTTRMVRPGPAFADFTGVINGSTSSTTDVSVDEPTRPFIYVSVSPNRASYNNCTATISSSAGTAPSAGQGTGSGWQYPADNPCLAPGVVPGSRLSYGRDPSLFIQCDSLSNPYITKCPPGSPFFSVRCSVCMVDPSSLTCSGVHPSSRR